MNMLFHLTLLPTQQNTSKPCLWYTGCSYFWSFISSQTFGLLCSSRLISLIFFSKFFHLNQMKFHFLSFYFFNFLFKEVILSMKFDNRINNFYSNCFLSSLYKLSWLAYQLNYLSSIHWNMLQINFAISFQFCSFPAIKLNSILISNLVLKSALLFLFLLKLDSVTL